jgi:flagellin FlaB
MRNDKRAEMGVGTMIIFIAMVLVAAVAASVLISTANDVREQATQTGVDAIRGVSSGYDVQYVSADVADNQVQTLRVYLKTGAGSPEIDASKLVVSITDGTTSADLVCNDTNTVVTGDRIIMTISGLSADPGTAITLKILPQYGYATDLSLRVPDVLTPGTMFLR